MSFYKITKSLTFLSFLKKINKALILGLSLLVSACSFPFMDDYEPVSFTVSGNTALMRGVIDSKIKSELENLLSQHPNITTISMVDVEGSVDDEANLEAARFVRSRGLNTHIPSTGVIASGGTDFFLAGVKRTVEKGARLGVHSWGGFGIDNADKLPRNHPEHVKYLQYYKVMGIPSDFYWFTLQASPSSGIHWMTEKELKRFRIRTGS